MSAAAMSYEWARLRSLKSTWILAAAAMAATALAAWGYAEMVVGMLGLGVAVDGAEALVLVVGRSSFTPVAAGVLGVLAIGGEYRHGTLRTTLMVTPRRSTALGAKAAVVTAFASALAVAGLAVGWLAASTSLAGRLDLAFGAAELVRFHAGQILLVVGWGLLGLAATAIVRSQLLGLAAILVLPFAVEPMFRTVGMLSGQAWLEAAAAYLPFAAGEAMMDISSGNASTLLAPAASRADPLIGGLVFFAVIAALAAAALTSFRRQDA